MIEHIKMMQVPYWHRHNVSVWTSASGTIQVTCFGISKNCASSNTVLTGGK